jgi:tape measure domain-containing protein
VSRPDITAYIAANDKEFRAAMQRLRRDARGASLDAQQSFNGLALRMAGYGRAIVSGAAIGLVAREYKDLSDAATRVDNALKVAGLSGAELEGVYDRLRDSALRNAAPLEALVGLYGRAAIVQKELGVSGEELLSFTDNIAIALRVSGKSATESAGALLQLSQALGAGTVRAEEFNSVQEGALPIAQAAARGLKEAGGSVARLKQLVIDGKVSSEAFFRAFEAGAPSLASAVADAEITSDQALGNLQTALLDTVREFNNATGASERFSGGINDIAKSIADVDVAGFIRKIEDAYETTDRFLDRLANSGLIERFAEAVTGLDLTVGQPIDLDTVEAQNKIASLDREVEALREHIEFEASMNVDTTEARAQLADLIRQADQMRAVLASPAHRAPAGTPGDYNSLASAPVSVPKSVKPVSLDDFDPPNKAKKSKSAKDRADEYERLAKRITEATAETVAETEARRQLNPLINDYGYALERARIEHELLAAAQEAGKEMTPGLRAEIAALADQYGLAAAEAARLAEEHDKMADDLEFRKGLLKDALGGLRSALADGKLEFEELGEIALNVLDKIIGKIEDELADALANLFSSGKGGGGSILSSLLGGLLGGGASDPWAGLRVPSFAKGVKNFGGGVALVGEEGPELLNLPRGSDILPSLETRDLLGGGNQQSVNLTNTFHIDASNAQPGVGAEIEAAVKRATKDMTPAVVKALRDIKKLGIAV